MRKLRWLTIVLLLAGATGLAYQLRTDWRSFRAKTDPNAIRLRPMPPVPVPDTPPARDYGIVAQQNPFHPERNDALPPPPAAAPKPTLGPPPLVYGSMILGKEKFALLATDSDPKPHKVLEGEQFNGYLLAEVKPQSVVFEADGSKNEVMLYNALARLRRTYQKTQASAPSAPASGAASGPAQPTTVAAAEPAGPPPPPPPVPGAKAPAGKKLVMTPFGPVWQDAQ